MVAQHAGGGGVRQAIPIFFICRVDIRQKKINYEVLWRITYKKVMYLELGGTVTCR